MICANITQVSAAVHTNNYIYIMAFSFAFEYLQTDIELNVQLEHIGCQLSGNIWHFTNICMTDLTDMFMKLAVVQTRFTVYNIKIYAKYGPFIVI